MSGFNDGIEAAAEVADKLAEDYKANAADAFHPGTAARWRMRAMAIEGTASAIRDLKRPEPSEAEKVERVARAMASAHFRGDVWNERNMSHEEREQWREMARAALKAMEDEE